MGQGGPVDTQQIVVELRADLWALLENEAAREGVSVEQYVREAALARAIAAAVLTGEGRFELLARGVRDVLTDEGSPERRHAGDLVLDALASMGTEERRQEARVLAVNGNGARRAAASHDGRRPGETNVEYVSRLWQALRAAGIEAI